MCSIEFGSSTWSLLPLRIHLQNLKTVQRCPMCNFFGRIQWRSVCLYWRLLQKHRWHMPKNDYLSSKQHGCEWKLRLQPRICDEKYGVRCAVPSQQRRQWTRRMCLQFWILQSQWWDLHARSWVPSLQPEKQSRNLRVHRRIHRFGRLLLSMRRRQDLLRRRTKMHSAMWN